MLPIVKSLGQRTRTLVRDGLAAVLALALCAASALAEEPASSPQSQARSLADEVLSKVVDAGSEGLGTWMRSVIDRALERAGGAARDTDGGTATAAPPLPAERHAARVAGGLALRPRTAEVLVFMSFAVPPASWREWAHEAARIGATEHAGPPLVLRGVGEGGLRETVREVGSRLGGAEAGVAIDPRLFRLFGIDRVPAVAVVPDGVPACRSRGCAEDAAPPHDLVIGNIGLVSALEAIAAEGDAGRDAARRVLERLDGDSRAGER